MATSNAGSARTRVFIMIKPLALEYPGLVAEIEKSIRKTGTVLRPELRRVDRNLCRAHYVSDTPQAPRASAKHLPALVNYLEGRTVLSLVLEQNGATPFAAGRDFCDFIRSEIIGPSEPMKCEKKHIRYHARSLHYRVPVAVPESDRISDYQPFAKDNLIHCSDSLKSAEREIALWYPSFG